jgi:hypothetical protein
MSVDRGTGERSDGASAPTEPTSDVPTASSDAGGSNEVSSAPPPSAPRVLLADELPFVGALPRAPDTTRLAHDPPKKNGRHHRPYHPAPGIIVNVIDAHGGVSAADLQRKARSSGYWPFRQCYEEGLRRDQRLTGRLSLDLLVSPSGAVDRSRLTSTTLTDEVVAACVAREAMHLSLPASGESQTTAKAEVSLNTGDEPVPSPRPAPNAEELRSALRASWPAAERCYEAGLIQHPDAGGRMELRFRIQPSGEILDVIEGDTRFGGADITRCVLSACQNAKLPAGGQGSKESSFVYALHFESTPAPSGSP